MKYQIVDTLLRNSGATTFRPLSPVFVKPAEPFNPLYSLAIEDEYVLTNKHLHGYFELYYSLLKSLNRASNARLCIIELGMGSIGNEKSTMKGFYEGMRRIHNLEYPFGGCLRLWERFFSKPPLLIGWDLEIDMDRIVWKNHNYVQVDTTDQVSLRLATAKTLSILEDKNADGIDMFIDDGLHEPASQLSVMKAVYPYIKHGGYYIIEDVNVDGITYETGTNRFISFSCDTSAIIAAAAEISGVAPQIYQFRGAGDQLSSIIVVNRSLISKNRSLSHPMDIGSSY